MFRRGVIGCCGSHFHVSLLSTLVTVRLLYPWLWYGYQDKEQVIRITVMHYSSSSFYSLERGNFQSFFFLSPRDITNSPIFEVEIFSCSFFCLCTLLDPKKLRKILRVLLVLNLALLFTLVIPTIFIMPSLDYKSNSVHLFLVDQAVHRTSVQVTIHLYSLHLMLACCLKHCPPCPLSLLIRMRQLWMVWR